jgi:hypothetical protein
MQKVSLLVVIVAVALAEAGSATSARPTVTVRVDDSRITAPKRWPAGYVDVHIVTAGNVHHHLAFWHLKPGVTVKRFVAALSSAKSPFDVGTAVGGNGPMLGGHLDVTLHLLPGTVVFADIVDGPTTRIASFHVSGPPGSGGPPKALGTIDNRSFRFALPTHFGRPGVYRFTNSDPVAHDGAIYRLREGQTAAGLVRWSRAGGKGRPPVDFSRPLGGPGVIGAHWTSWFTLPALHRATTSSAASSLTTAGCSTRPSAWSPDSRCTDAPRSLSDS